MNIFARTALTPVYPQYVSINERGGGVEITVRSPASGQACGPSAAATISKDEALEMARAILHQYGTL